LVRIREGEGRRVSFPAAYRKGKRGKGKFEVHGWISFVWPHTAITMTKHYFKAVLKIFFVLEILEIDLFRCALLKKTRSFCSGQRPLRPEVGTNSAR
jgi:hypothetical protein